MDDETILMMLRKRKVFTIDQLIYFLNGSMRTARRRIQQWKVYTSINQNGRYYTLPDIPQFDSNGLWRYRNVLFSPTWQFETNDRPFNPAIAPWIDGAGTYGIAGSSDTNLSDSFTRVVRSTPGETSWTVYLFRGRRQNLCATKTPVGGSRGRNQRAIVG